MKKVTYFDVEWANSKNKSICQMGIMCEDFETDEPICREKNIYINPEDGFDPRCVSKHHITTQQVATMPTFPQVWEKVKSCFINSIVIGHNVAGADLNALTKCLQRYQLDVPELHYIDTYEIALRFIPAGVVSNYKMETLCEYFGIAIDTEHDAFNDACANKDLLLALKKLYNINLDKFIHRYWVYNDFYFDNYISNSDLRKVVCEIYGVIQGIGFDNNLSSEEFDLITELRNSNRHLINCEIVSPIFNLIDKILAEKIITKEELRILHQTISNYFLTISASNTTLAIQILLGILKGITCDKNITVDECEAMRNWLYEHDYLRGNYPFDIILNSLETILQDNVITKSESEKLIDKINSILNPINMLKSQVYNVRGCTVYLSGNFSYGRKDKVAKYIEERGGTVVKSVTKSLDFLIIGDLGCDEYAYGSFGGNIQKALEYNAKYSTNILLITEKDFFSTIK